MKKNASKLPALTIAGPRQMDLIVIGAFRYYLGRMTYAVSSFTDWLIANWPALTENSRRIIQYELDEAFEHDNADRKKPDQFRWTLGHDCDRHSWSRVRRLYRTPRCCLCDKEMGEDATGSVHQDGEYACTECAPHECEVCNGEIFIGEAIIPNRKTRRHRHPGCKPAEDLPKT